ncbi:2-aminoethylphosphonate ABC transporter permease subunit [Pseudonocardia spinosispora]|uniref:2-aminoethylphosphonate ABC transporter permease subunit n=1 Tax=Pseudonocardia spinosispora TaxID=103441 RepID=UPI000401AB8A|nr:2-aminoethylphosphonate ABC transporter permease subunit [Pseudonocardia spinosispora]
MAVLDPPRPIAPAPAPARMRALGLFWRYAPLAVVVVGVAWPMLAVLAESLVTGRDGRGAQRWGSVLSSGAFLDALGRTAQIAVCTTIGCLVLGTFLALVLAFVPFPGARLVGRLIDSVLALPSFLITLAFTFLYGSAGVLSSVVAGLGGGRMPALLTTPWGVVLAEVTFFTPFVVRPLLAALTLVPREQLDVASSLGAGPMRVLRQIVLPEVLPALAAGGSLVLLLALNEFGIVLFTGAKDVITLPVLIYTRGVVTLDLPTASVVATAQVVLSLALYSVYRASFARLDTRGGSGRAAVVPGL